MNVRSDPTEANIEDSERLKRTAETVSVDVENVRLDMGALLQSPCVVSGRIDWAFGSNKRTLFHPKLERYWTQLRTADPSCGDLSNCSSVSRRDV